MRHSPVSERVLFDIAKARATRTFWIDVKRKKKAGQSDVATMDKIAPDDLQAEDFDMSGLDIRAMDVDEDVKTLIIEQQQKNAGSSDSSDSDSGQNRDLRGEIQEKEELSKQDQQQCQRR